MGIKSLRFIAIAGVAAGVVLALAPAANATTAQHGNGPDRVVSHGINAQQSSNWSGYAETGSGFTSATANWTVPTVTASSGNTYSSAWVGIDGDGNSNLIQTGTEADYAGGRATYRPTVSRAAPASVPFQSAARARRANAGSDFEPVFFMMELR